VAEKVAAEKETEPGWVEAAAAAVAVAVTAAAAVAVTAEATAAAVGVAAVVEEAIELPRASEEFITKGTRKKFDPIRPPEPRHQ